MAKHPKDIAPALEAIVVRGPRAGRKMRHRCGTVVGRDVRSIG
jgi:hypothetical protein